MSRRIIVCLEVELEEGADPGVVAEGLFDLACSMPEGTELDAAVASVDGYEWEPTNA